MKIKFITINIWHGKFFDSLVSFIREQDPDIITMQEVYDGKDASFDRHLRILDELKKILNFDYVAFAPSLIDTRPSGKVPWGNAVFSKHPIVDQKNIFYSIPFGEYDLEKNTTFELAPRNLQQLTFSVNSKKLYVFNTHGIWGKNGQDNPERLAMSNIITKAIKGKSPLILAGDFNLKPKTQTIRNIEKFLTNVFKNELITTFNMKRKSNPDYGTSVVDMVFVSKDIKVVEHFCPVVDISDHFPLICIFEI